jgi:hypothetical protein
MGKPIVEFTSKLNKATSSRGADGIPNVTLIAADADGNIASGCASYVVAQFSQEMLSRK